MIVHFLLVGWVGLVVQRPLSPEQLPYICLSTLHLSLCFSSSVWPQFLSLFASIPLSLLCVSQHSMSFSSSLHLFLSYLSSVSPPEFLPSVYPICLSTSISPPLSLLYVSSPLPLLYRSLALFLFPSFSFLCIFLCFFPLPICFSLSLSAISLLSLTLFFPLLLSPFTPYGPPPPAPSLPQGVITWDDSRRWYINVTSWRNCHQLRGWYHTTVKKKYKNNFRENKSLQH